MQKIDTFMREHASTDSDGRDYWKAIIDSYSSDYVKSITDTKYGFGATDYIIAAFQYYSNNAAKKSK